MLLAVSAWHLWRGQGGSRSCLKGATNPLGRSLQSRLSIQEVKPSGRKLPTQGVGLLGANLQFQQKS